MAYVQIPNLPAAVGNLAGDELFEGVQAGSSVKISLNQIVAASRTGLPTTLPISVDLGGTGVSTITGYIKGSGNSPFTGASTIPSTDITGLGTMSTQDANAVAITGGSITGITDLAVADGGTGQGSPLTQYGMIYGSTATSMASTAAGTSVQVLHGNASGAPTWGSVSLTADVSGTLPVVNGGTGLIGSLVQYGVVYGSTTTNMASTAAGTSSQVLHGNASGAPTFGAVALATEVSGQLPLANGGTGINAVSTAAVNAALMGYTSTATTGATIPALTNTSTQYQLFTGTLTQVVTLPVTSTLTTGWTFHIVNNSTGNLTVNASSGALVCTVISGMTAMVTCIDVAVTTAAAWEFGFTDFGLITGTGAVVLGTGPTITNGALNGTVGATTPSTGVFTSVTNNSGQLYSLRQFFLFTSGTAATYTPTANTKAIRITIVGGGGGGGGVSSAGTTGYAGGAGGGGAGAVSSIVITSLSASYTYTVGSGGAGGAAGANNGAAGGTTTFSGGAVSLSASGGGAGLSRVATLTSAAGRGGAGGTSSGGTLNFAGQDGTAGLVISGSCASAGNGGSGPYGSFGAGLVANGLNQAGNGSAATGYGAGGGGGGCFGTTATTAAGGAGSGGVIIVEELG